MAAFGAAFLSCAMYGQNQPSATAYLPITMQQAVDLARVKNPTLLSAQQNLLSVKAQEIQAGVRTNPYFGFTGSNVTLPAEGASNPYAYSLQLSRLFERGDKRRWRLDTARSTTAQTD
ncbi:MAG: TolC family protein, partial [Edaphobacter sp.]